MTTFKGNGRRTVDTIVYDLATKAIHGHWGVTSVREDKTFSRWRVSAVM